jgi:hypothetical protein
MECQMKLTATAKRTRMELRTTAGKLLLRGSLPPLDEVHHHRAVKTLLEGLSLWMDQRVCVVLDAVDRDSCFAFDLTDELGVGVHSVFYAVEVAHRRGAGRDELQLPLAARPAGAP